MALKPRDEHDVKGRDLSGVGHDFVAARAFGAIQRLVGAVQQRFGGVVSPSMLAMPMEMVMFS